MAAGKKKPHEPQPYAVLDFDDLLYKPQEPQHKYRVRACAVDPQRGHLYVIEFRGDEDDKSLVHVWTVRR